MPGRHHPTQNISYPGRVDNVACRRLVWVVCLSVLFHPSAIHHDHSVMVIHLIQNCHNDTRMITRTRLLTGQPRTVRYSLGGFAFIGGDANITQERRSQGRRQYHGGETPSTLDAGETFAYRSTATTTHDTRQSILARTQYFGSSDDRQLRQTQQLRELEGVYMEGTHLLRAVGVAPP